MGDVSWCSRMTQLSLSPMRQGLGLFVARRSSDMPYEFKIGQPGDVLIGTYGDYIVDFGPGGRILTVLS
jgi:hypothetical protein